MAQSKVPKFGSREAGENVAYTAYFDTARKGKPGGPIINPNNSQMNQDVVPPAATPRQTKPEPTKLPKFGAWEGAEEVPYTEYFENPRKVKATPAPTEPHLNQDVGPTTRQPKPTPAMAKPNGKHGMSSGDPRAKPQGVKFVGGELSAKQSPLHHGMGGRGAGSTPSFSDSIQGSSGRPQQKRSPSRGPNLGRGASVPVFGGWNNNPAQADGYTVVFDQLKKDKKEGMTPNVGANSTTYQNTPGRAAEQTKQGGCFSWLFG